MSTERGNTHRTRPQKYQNHFAFKNTLYDTSKRTKTINSLQVVNVCERCKKIIEWKIKYKKYKPLKVPGKCNKCEKRAVKHAYHTICSPCARECRVCPKCGSKSELVTPNLSNEEEIKLNTEMQEMLKTLPERKRRTFMRYANKQKNQKKKLNKNVDEVTDENKKNDKDNSEENVFTSEFSHEHLFNKLKSLIINNEKDSDDSNSDFSDENSELD